MPKAPKAKKAAPPPTPYDAPKPAAEEKAGPMWEKKPKNFSIGGDIRPKMDMGRFVAWPKYVRLQRQRKILYERLKVPPAINQFSFTLDKQLATNFFKLASKYKPEPKKTKKDRLKGAAAEEVETGEQSAREATFAIKYGINHVTSLVEQKKAGLVVIAHDVDPIELVCWLPTLCRKMDVPYAIVKGKSRLGQLVHKKTATALALPNVRDEDRKAYGNLLTAVKEMNTERGDEFRKRWGGNIMGSKSQAATRKREKALEREAAKKAMAQF